jgi:predicted Ser/Thr protein kinase
LHNECRTKSREIQNIKHNIKVIKYDIKGCLITEYDSVTIAAQQNNVTKAGISMVCHGKRKQLKGFIYTFFNANN